MDYKKIGFKCGIEVHRQLSTKKLFCDCPSLVNDPNEADVHFIRKLRSSRGESGKFDQAAEFEEQKNKYFIYEGASTSSCLVEMDEQPPKEVNQEALKVSLQVAKLLNCEIVDQIQFMRKTVIDGSNTSGFQRTALIGMDGFIETSKGKVGISIICLEEEAAKKIEGHDDYVKYRLDRLGVPLLEIATDASIKDAEHAKEVAAQIGMIVKSTGKGRSGIGSVRQDVNLSITNSPRIEIKGFQELRQIPLVISKEVVRLQKEMNSGTELESQVRKANADGSTDFLRPMPGEARMYPETDVETILVSKEMLEAIEVPELIFERVIKLEKEYGLSAPLARKAAESSNFTEFVNEFNKIDPKVIASALIEIPKDAKKRLKVIVKDFHVREVLSLVQKKQISSNSIKEAIIDYAKDGKLSPGQYQEVSEEKIRMEIRKILDEQKDPNIGSVMGALMEKFRGRVSGEKVSKLVRDMIG